MVSQGTIEDINPFRYAGYWYDAEIDKYYLNARYYDPKIGRFLSKDPVALRVGNHNSLNAYVYANNNPNQFWDPMGMANGGHELYEFDNTHKANVPVNSTKSTGSNSGGVSGTDLAKTFTAGAKYAGANMTGNGGGKVAAAVDLVAVAADVSGAKGVGAAAGAISSQMDTVGLTKGSPAKTLWQQRGAVLFKSAGVIGNLFAIWDGIDDISGSDRDPYKLTAGFLKVVGGVVATVGLGTANPILASIGGALILAGAFVDMSASVMKE